MNQDTLFTDDDGNKIYDGDTIEWSYIPLGGYIEDKFFEFYGVGQVAGDRKVRLQVMKFEKISDTVSGYRLDRPQKGWTATEIKCKKIIE